MKWLEEKKKTRSKTTNLRFLKILLYHMLINNRCCNPPVEYPSNQTMNNVDENTSKYTI